MQLESVPCCPPWICSKPVYFIYCLSYFVSTAGQFFFSLLLLQLIAPFGCLHMDFSRAKSLTTLNKGASEVKLQSLRSTGLLMTMQQKHSPVAGNLGILLNCHHWGDLDLKLNRFLPQTVEDQLLRVCSSSVQV